MPSHRREAGTALHFQTLLPYTKSCTPQSHPRSDITSFSSFSISPGDTIESWFPMSGFDAARDCKTSTMEVPQRTEHRVIASEDVDMETAFHLGDFQEWQWPPARGTGSAGDIPLIGSNTVAQNQGGCDDKPSNGTLSLQELKEQSFDLQAWCNQSNTVQPVTNCVVPKGHSSGPPMATSLVPVVEPLTPVSEKGRGARGNSVSAPATPSEWRATKGAAEKCLGVKQRTGKRAVSQRESHIWSERQRRKGMNHLFSTLRSLLPQPTSKTDKSTVVSEIIKYIQSLQQKLEVLLKKRQQMFATRTLQPFHTSDTHKTILSNGLTLVDRTGDANAFTALAALPVPGSESCLQSYLGANVGLHVCGLNCFITISSPRGQRGVFQRILVAVQNHHLEVINANISTSKASVFHCLHCQATQGSDLLSKENLHTSLQSVITNFDVLP